MTTWQVALVKEQGVNFAVVLVNDSVIGSPSQRDDLVQWWSRELGVPAVLLGERRFRSFGRSDIVRFLRNIHPARLPWRRMTTAA